MADLQDQTKSHLEVSLRLASQAGLDVRRLAQTLLLNQRAVKHELFNLRDNWPVGGGGVASMEDDGESTFLAAAAATGVTEGDLRTLARQVNEGTRGVCQELAGLAETFAAALTTPLVHGDFTAGWLEYTGAEFTENKVTRTAGDPDADDDDLSGYTVGSLWFNTTADTMWACLDDTTSAAVWVEVTVTDHGNLDGLGDDDHTQYHNDTRGDARYYRENEHLNSSAGAGDAGKPIVLDAAGHVDASMVNDADVDHDSTGGFVANEHVDHSSVSISAGTGLTGGGNITATRTLTLDAALTELNNVTIASPADNEVLAYNVGDTTWKNQTPAEAGLATASDLSSHTGNTGNPHTVTLAQVGGAPVGAQYVALAVDATLTDERVLTAGEGIDLADGGAGGNVTISGEDATTANKGIASFAAADFGVAAGAVTLDATKRTWGKVYYIENPVAADDYPLGAIPVAGAVTRVTHITDTGTVDFNVEKRAEATPLSAGTDIWSADKTANTTSTAETSFDSAAITARDSLWACVSAVASSPTKLVLYVEGTVT